MIFYYILDFIYFFSLNLIGQYGALTGVLLTAGFTYLVYAASIRDKNFFQLSEKYETRCMDANFIIGKIEIKSGKIVYKGSGKSIEGNTKDLLWLGNFYNLFYQMSILWQKNQINKKLTYYHFAGILIRAYEADGKVLEFLDSVSSIDKDVLILYKIFKKIVSIRKYKFLGIHLENFYFL